MKNTNENYDVIIIGAGPAGLSCAFELSKSDLKILVLEQKEIIGPKVCAGGLTRKDLRHIKIPGELLDYGFREIKVHTPLISTIVKDPAAMISTIDRKTLADWQLEKLEGAKNIEIKTNCKVREISDGAVIVNGSETYGYRFLVGADGSFSRVRKFLDLETEKIAIAIQYIVPTEKYKELEFFLDSKLFKSWYAWIFPHKGYASIGCMCDPRYLSSKELQENFIIWLRKNRVDVSRASKQGYAINYDYRGFKFGNIFLAGDAAGFASGLTGEGIYQAYVSGGEVAKSILDEKYESVEINKLLETKTLHETAMRNVIRMGTLGNIFFASLVPLIKNRKMAYKIIKYVS